MISKLVKLSRCTLCCKVLSQSLSRNIHANETTPVSDIKPSSNNHPSPFATKYGKRVRKAVVNINEEHIEAVTAVLKKHNVDISDLDDESDIFLETPWAIEKRIMLIEEMGASNITTAMVLYFHQGLQLPLSIFKANMQLNSNQSIAENLFSYTNNRNFDPKKIGISEDQPTKKYLHLCLIHYLEKELNLNQTQIKQLVNKKDNRYIFHSFRLFKKVLQFLQNDIMLSKTKILKHHNWLCTLHPDQLQTTYNLVSEIAKEHTPFIARRYPPLFEHDLKDLKIIISLLKEIGVTPKAVIASSIVRVFQITSDELERRFAYLSKNQFTQVFLKHPRFINLIAYYHSTLPRLRYLEENNLKYATIYSLTTYHDYHQELVTFKKINKNDLQSFFEVQFGEQAEELFQKFKNHVFSKYVPLISMKESLFYLQTIFPEKVIHEHIYAILYNEKDLQAAYEVAVKDPNHRKLPPSQLLTLCLYTIEVNFHFSGDPVLAPGKYAESLKKTVDQDKEKISDVK